MTRAHDPKSLCVITGAYTHAGAAKLPLAKSHHFADGLWTSGKTVFPSLVDATETRPASGIEELSDWLFRFAENENAAIVRGYISTSAGVPKKYVGGPSKDAPFVACDRQWLMVDIDKIPLPDGADTSDSDAVDYAVSLLPDCFSGAAFHYHFSAGYRISKPGTVSIHLWYWLSRPACCESLRKFASANPPFDVAVYNPVQLHFTADPIIVGCDDPVKNRSGFRPGAPEVVLPDSVLGLAAWQLKHAEFNAREADDRRMRAMLNRYNPRAKDAQQRYAVSVVNRVMNAMLAEPEGHRHRAIVKAAYRLGSLSAYLDASVFSILEANAIALLPDNRRGEAIRTVRQCWELGKRDPTDLSHIS